MFLFTKKEKEKEKEQEQDRFRRATKKTGPTPIANRSEQTNKVPIWEQQKKRRLVETQTLAHRSEKTEKLSQRSPWIRQLGEAAEGFSKVFTESSCGGTPSMSHSSSPELLSEKE